MSSFIDKADYLQCIDEKGLLALGATDDKLSAAENTAIDEAKGYLDKYDCDELFAKIDNDRPQKLVGVICDIALFHIASSSSSRMGYDTRKDRYDLAISYLKGIQSGKITPKNFPTLVTEKNNASVMFGGEEPSSFIW